MKQPNPELHVQDPGAVQLPRTHALLHTGTVHSEPVHLTEKIIESSQK